MAYNFSAVPKTLSSLGLLPRESESLGGRLNKMLFERPALSGVLAFFFA